MAETVATQRWQRRKEARPGEILEAALSVFAERGYAATRMDDIAAQAGITKGTLYLYFEGKDDLFKSLVRESIGSTIEDAGTVLRTYDGMTEDLLKLVLLRMGHLIVTTNRFVLAKIIIAESGNFPELARFYRTEIIGRGLALLSQVIERGISRGEFRAIDPQHAARLCVAPLLLIGLWRATFEKFDDEKYDYEGMVEAHLRTLLAGLKPEPGQK